MRHFVTIFAAVALFTSAHAATVSLLATGEVTTAWQAHYPAAEVGDAFRLSVTFTDGAPDSMSEPYTGLYNPVDLVMSLDIIGKGLVFTGMGGSVAPGLMCDIYSGLPCYPAITISSPSADGYALTLRFADRDGSRFQAERLPFANVHIEDYEAIDFLLIASGQPEQGSLTGTALALQIPEVSTASMFLAALGLVCMARRRSPEQRE